MNRKRDAAEAVSQCKSKKRGKTAKNSGDVYDVEKIMDCRWSNEKQAFEYLIKWEKFDHTANTWESAANLDGCPKLVEEYHQNVASRDLVKAGGQNGMKLGNGRSIFRGEDAIDATLLSHLGPKFPFDTWKLKKTGTGCYTIKYQGIGSNIKEVSTSASSPSTKSEVDHSEEVFGGSSKKGPSDPTAKLAAWLAQVNAICKASGEAPLRIENTVDKSSISSGELVYITALRANRDDIPIPNDPIVGCTCTEERGSCRKNSNGCCAAQMNSEFAYFVNGKLCLDLGRPIYECNKLCQCDETCANRIVQKGRQIELCIFRTEDSRGWGVKAVTKIKKNTFVTEYVGEIIRKDAADQRGDASYMFTLDFIDLPLYVVDAKYYGNVARFINHSCEPNLSVFGAWIEHLEASLPRLHFSRCVTLSRMRN